MLRILSADRDVKLGTDLTGGVAHPLGDLCRLHPRPHDGSGVSARGIDDPIVCHRIPEQFTADSSWTDQAGPVLVEPGRHRGNALIVDRGLQRRRSQIGVALLHAGEELLALLLVGKGPDIFTTEEDLPVLVDGVLPYPLAFQQSRFEVLQPIPQRIEPHLAFVIPFGDLHRLRSDRVAESLIELPTIHQAEGERPVRQGGVGIVVRLVRRHLPGRHVTRDRVVTPIRSGVARVGSRDSQHSRLRIGARSPWPLLGATCTPAVPVVRR